MNNGTTVHIEVQVAKDNYIFQRCLLYWAKQYGKNLHEGDGFEKLKPLVTICLCNYNRDSGNENYYNRYHIYNDTDMTIATNHLDMIFLELKKFKIANFNHLKDSDRWLAYLSNLGNTKERSVIMDSDVMREVDDAEKRFLGDWGLYTEYLNREFAKRDKRSQLLTAQNDWKRDVVNNMKKENFTINQISRALNLSVDEIQSLLMTDKA